MRYIYKFLMIAIAAAGISTSAAQAGTFSEGMSYTTSSSLFGSSGESMFGEVYEWELFEAFVRHNDRGQVNESCCRYRVTDEFEFPGGEIREATFEKTCCKKVSGTSGAGLGYCVMINGERFCDMKRNSCPTDKKEISKMRCSNFHEVTDAGK